MNNTINLKDLASKVQAYHNCIASNNQEWKDKHEDAINSICEALPHGSGLDGKMQIELPESTSKKLVFFFEYHHMDENGFYSGWTEHNLIITPEFGNYSMRITGRDRNQTKDYLYDLFSNIFQVN